MAQLRPLTLLIFLFLAACAREHVVTETEIIYQEIPAWKPIPEEFTDPLPIPIPPPHRITVDDLIDLVEQLMTLLEQANADRADLRALQPDGTD